VVPSVVAPGKAVAIIIAKVGEEELVGDGVFNVTGDSVAVQVEEDHRCRIERDTGLGCAVFGQLESSESVSFEVQLGRETHVFECEFSILVAVDMGKGWGNWEKAEEVVNGDEQIPFRVEATGFGRDAISSKFRNLFNEAVVITV
jgi:hypothetical protein